MAYESLMAGMPYVIAAPCIATCDTACVNVCPVDCISGPILTDATKHALQLYIDPDTCISCGACEPECPVEAIFDEPDLPEEWAHFAALNAAWFAR